MPPKTRAGSGDLRPPAPLPHPGQLNDHLDIIAAVKFESIARDRNEAIEVVGDQVVTKFKKVNPKLPLLAGPSVIQKISRLVQTEEKYRRKWLTGNQTKNFLDKGSKLFDIISCQCMIVACSPQICTGVKTCSGYHILCKCKEAKIPEMEVSFVRDQRLKVGTAGGKQILGSVDKREAKKQAKVAKRNEMRKAGAECVEKNLEAKKVEASKERQRREKVISEVIEEVEEVNEVQISEGGLEDVHLNKALEKKAARSQKISSQNRVDIGAFAAEVCRFSISDRAGAALWNSVVKCLGDAHLLAHSSGDDIDDCLKTDKSKLRREKRRFAEKEKSRLKAERGEKVECIGTDGKRDKKTWKKEISVVNGEQIEKDVRGVEEHLVYTVEPSGKYLTHSTVKEGRGKDLASDFRDVLAEYDAIDSLLAVLVDGTNVNTGWRTGLVASLERGLQRKLIMISCMLHANDPGVYRSKIMKIKHKYFTRPIPMAPHFKILMSWRYL